MTPTLLSVDDWQNGCFLQFPQIPQSDEFPQREPTMITPTVFQTQFRKELTDADEPVVQTNEAKEIKDESQDKKQKQPIKKMKVRKQEELDEVLAAFDANIAKVRAELKECFEFLNAYPAYLEPNESRRHMQQLTAHKPSNFVLTEELQAKPRNLKYVCDPQMHHTVFESRVQCYLQTALKTFEEILRSHVKLAQEKRRRRVFNSMTQAQNHIKQGNTTDAKGVPYQTYTVFDSANVISSDWQLRHPVWEGANIWNVKKTVKRERSRKKRKLK
jgi:hypothetical protein